MDDCFPGRIMRRSCNFFQLPKRLIFIAVWKNNFSGKIRQTTVNTPHLNPLQWNCSQIGLKYFNSYVKIQLAIILASQFPIHHQYLFSVKWRDMELKTQFLSRLRHLSENFKNCFFFTEKIMKISKFVYKTYNFLLSD